MVVSLSEPTLLLRNTANAAGVTPGLARELGERGWVAAFAPGGERAVTAALQTVSDQLGRVVEARTRSAHELITPRPTDAAHPRSLSARHGLGPLPLHVELSHRERPCRYVAFGCLDPGNPSVDTTILDRRSLALSAEDRALLRNAVVLVRSGRRSFYSSILTADEAYLRFDAGCLEAVDARGREAMAMFEDRLARSTPFRHPWVAGGVLILDNWRVLHGRASAERSKGRRLMRVLIDD